MSNKMANAMMNKNEVIKNRYNFSFFIEVVYNKRSKIAHDFSRWVELRQKLTFPSAHQKAQNNN